MIQRSFLLVLILWIALPSFARRQEQTIKVAVREVYLQVRVFDRGQPLALKKDNFRVWEEVKNMQGKTERVEQTINDFSRYNDISTALGAAIDSSGSMEFSPFPGSRNKLEMAKNSCRDLFTTIFREGRDRGLVAEFFYESARHILDNGRHLVILTNLFVNQDWTSRLSEIYSGIAKVDKAGGATPLRDAMYNLAGHFQEVQGDFLRVAVVISDGGDAPEETLPGAVKINSHTLAEVIAELQNNQVMVFAVGLYKKSLFPIERIPAGFQLTGPDILEVMAKATGGEAFYETDLSQLARIFTRIGSMIRDVNTLSYTPTSNVKGSRTLYVEVGEWGEGGKWHKKKATLFYRKGYYYRP